MVEVKSSKMKEIFRLSQQVKTFLVIYDIITVSSYILLLNGQVYKNIFSMAERRFLEAVKSGAHCSNLYSSSMGIVWIMRRH